MDFCKLWKRKPTPTNCRESKKQRKNEARESNGDLDVCYLTTHFIERIVLHFEDYSSSYFDELGWLIENNFQILFFFCWIW